MLLTAGTWRQARNDSAWNSQIMIHPAAGRQRKPARRRHPDPRQGIQVKASALNHILIKHTGHQLDQIERDTDRDRFMAAEEALEYKLIDQVIDHMETKIAAANGKTPPAEK